MNKYLILTVYCIHVLIGSRLSSKYVGFEQDVIVILFTIASTLVFIFMWLLFYKDDKG